MKKFYGIVHLIIEYADKIAQVAVMALMLLVVANILGRFVGLSIFGTYDFAGFINAILVGFALAYCAMQKGHIQVEIVMTRFPEKVQAVVGIIMGILSLGMFSIITWQCVLLANDKLIGGEVSMTALVPYYPYVYGVAIGLALLCLIILEEIIEFFVKVVKH
jgi:TRAP-type C4-dicarboxylate transport system permease small subunit